MLREIKSKEIYNIIVDTDREHIQLFFRNLLQLQMNNDKVSEFCVIQLNILFSWQYHYTFTSFDVETLDLEDFKYNHVNITAFR